MFERCLYFNLNALTRHINKIWDQAFDSFGLSPPHAYLLRVVLAEPGMTQRQIAEILQLEKSTITRFIDVLEGKALLYRQKSGREQLVYPSKTAIKIHQQLDAQGGELYEKMQNSLGEQGLAQLVTDLRQARKHLD